MSFSKQSDFSSEALDALGLSEDASPTDIQKAWRKIAFECHPDRNPEALDTFVAAKEAYDFLTNALSPQELGKRQPKPEEKVEPKKHFSRLHMRVERLTDNVLGECKEALEKAMAKQLPGDGPTKAHLATEVHRKGRKLVFVVRDSLYEGINRVAVPTGLLQDNRRAMPKVLLFRSKKTVEREIELPEALREEVFPGARSVRIMFGQDLASWAA